MPKTNDVTVRVLLIISFIELDPIDYWRFFCYTLIFVVDRTMRTSFREKQIGAKVTRSHAGNLSCDNLLD